MLDSLLSALGYVGSSLAKPGRAVRGLLGGRPEELLAALPFSDSMGITDEKNAVSGRDLLTQLGMDPGEGIGGDIAGFGADVATDPLTYLGGAALRGGLKMLDRGGTTLSKASATADAIPKGDIFDLVSPADKEIGALNPELGAKAVPRELPGLDLPDIAEDAPNPLLDALGGGSKPDALTELPAFGDYTHKLGYGPDFPTQGVPHDMMQDLGPAAGFKGSISGWDDALTDLERLAPELRGQLMGHYPGGGATWSPPTGAGGDWQTAIRSRLGELDALQQLAPAGVPADALEMASKQAERLNPFYTGEGYRGSARLGVNNVMRGQVMPSQIDSLMGEIGHLPFDPVALRKLMAQTQNESALASIEGRVHQILPQSDFPIRDLAGHYGHADLVAELQSMLDPTHLLEQGIEPGIAKAAVTNPMGPGSDTVRQVQDLLQQLLAAR